MAIWQDLVDDHGFAGALREREALRAEAARQRRRPRRTRSSRPRPARRRRSTTATGPMVRHPETGKYRRTRLFVLTLGYSRKSVRLLTWKSSIADLGRAARAGLSPARRRRRASSCSTTSRRACSRRTSTTPTLNPLYRDVLAHYGVVALPCRVARPRSQGQGRVGRRPRAEDAAARACASRASRRRRPTSTAGRSAGPTRASTARPSARSRRCLPRRSPHLQPLPLEPFRYYQLRRAHRAPRRLRRGRGRLLRRAAGLDRPAASRCSGTRSHVRLLDPKTGQLLREHLRSSRAAAIASTTRIGPRARRAATLQLLAPRAHAPATHIGTLCEPIHQTRRRARRAPHPRRALAGQEARPRAPSTTRAQAALELGAPTYRFVRRYLERRPPRRSRCGRWIR